MKEISLTQSKVALVDDEEYCRLNADRWQAMEVWPERWYAGRQCNGGIVYMHRELMSAQGGCHIHHDNGNSLDNTRVNLIPMTPSEHAKIHQFGTIYKLGTTRNRKPQTHNRAMTRAAGLLLLDVARLLLVQKQVAEAVYINDQTFNLCGVARELGVSRQRIQQIALCRAIVIHETYYWKFTQQDIALMRGINGLRAVHIPRVFRDFV